MGSPRYNIPPYTKGWFQLAWSRDLGKGELRKVVQFGKEYTLFRGEDGKVGVIDDVCPHLGARFSEGGCVKGNSVQCPYHHWQFDRSGACTGIEYAKKIPKKARVGAHTVEEVHGMIFMYRDHSGGAPDYPLPPIHDFDPDNYLEPRTFDVKVRIHGQDIMENSVDSPHFWAVHGHQMPVNEFFTQDDELRVTQTSSVNKFGRKLDVRLEFHLVEPGFHYIHFPVMPGGAQAFLFSSIVPVDDEYTNHRLTIMVKRGGPPGYARILQRFLVWQMMKTYYEDVQIWEHKEYHSRPVLCDGDGSIMKLRRWFSQFYEQETEPGRHSLEVV